MPYMESVEDAVAITSYARQKTNQQKVGCKQDIYRQLKKILGQIWVNHMFSLNH